MAKTVCDNQANNILNPFGDVDRDEDGFIRMKPTEHGKRMLEEIRKKNSKVTVEEVTKTKDVVADEPAEEVKEFDIEPMSELLDLMEDYVRAGKYDRALAYNDTQVVSDFISAHEKVDLSTELGKKLNGMMRKFLSICKSFYEYDDKQREVINNVVYDGLIARYLASGAIEPVGIVPKGLKNLRKVSIRYPSLHNNMDKAYAIMHDDPIPDGVKEADTIEDFLNRVYKELDATSETPISLELSPKIDGVSMNGTIHGDMLIDPQTRGDEDESVAVIGANGMALAEGFTADTEFGIQFEAFCTEEDATKASEYLCLERPYVSCRHAAAGIIHRLCTMEDDVLLKFINLYPINTADLDGTYEERIDYIQNFGIIPDDMPKRITVKGTKSELLKAIKCRFNELSDCREKLSFAIDGVVITVLGDEYQEILGRSGRTNKYQIALKFDPATAIGQPFGVTLDSGNKGYRTIQVHLKHPVFLDGVRYDHVPVLSLPLFEELHLRTDSTVKIHRVGDVIPSISVIDEGSGWPLVAPTNCPCCKNRLIVRNKKLYCDNPSCSDNIVGNLNHFFSQMGMVGYSTSFCKMLVDNMGCTCIGDVLKLNDNDFIDRGVTSSLANGFVGKLKEAIAKHSDFEVLGALGLPGVGTEKAKILLQNIDMTQPCGTFLKNKYDTTLNTACIAAVGENQADLLESAITDPKFMTSWNMIIPMIKFTKDFSESLRIGHTGGALSEELLQVCRDNGFSITDGKSFDILITTSMSRSSGKMDAARKKSLPIFLEEDFIKKYKS